MTGVSRAAGSGCRSLPPHLWTATKTRWLGRSPGRLSLAKRGARPATPWLRCDAAAAVAVERRSNWGPWRALLGLLGSMNSSDQAAEVQNEPKEALVRLNWLVAGPGPPAAAR